MPRLLIEREIAEIGSAEREALREAAEKSNGVVAEMQASARSSERVGYPESAARR